MQISIPSKRSHVGTYSSHSQLVFVEIYFQISLKFQWLYTQGGKHHYDFYSPLFKYGPCRQLLVKNKIAIPCSSLKSLVVPKTPRI